MQKLEEEKYAKENFVKQQEPQKDLERHARGLVYNIALLVAISLRQSPSSFECEEGRSFKVGINVIVMCRWNSCVNMIYVGEAEEGHFQKENESCNGTWCNNVRTYIGDLGFKWWKC